MTPAGRLGAFITKVKRGSIADSVGHLQAGKYIIALRVCFLYTRNALFMYFYIHVHLFLLRV